jgi:hypothetical protein
VKGLDPSRFGGTGNFTGRRGGQVGASCGKHGVGDGEWRLDEEHVGMPYQLDDQ